MFFFYIIKLIFIDYLTFKLEIKYILQTIHFFTYVPCKFTHLIFM